ncbi:MAG: DUF3558 family protein [Rudaea sp.]
MKLCLLFSSITLALLCAGCGKQASTQDASTAPSASTKEGAAATASALAVHDPRDPCGVLEPAEVEPALGGPLGVAPYRADANHTPDASGNYCVYRSKDLHSIVVDVTWSNGQKMMKMLGGITSGMNAVSKGQVKLPIGGTTLDGDWDVAMFANCCTLMALRDDSMVTINIGGSRATQEQAAKLADAAMRHLKKPLPIDGASSVDAAARLLNARPQFADACALLTRADAESVLGPLTADPTPKSNNQCVYSFTNARGHLDQEWLKLVERDGFHAFRERNNIFETVDRQSAQAGAGMNDQSRAVLAGLTAMHTHKPESAGPWDDATSSTFEFDIVRHDTFVTVGSGTLEHDRMRALAEKIGTKL